MKGPDDDKLSSIASRFSYFQDKRHAAIIAATKSSLQRKNNPPVRSKNARPTVRLRPRQVLCNNCRSICNENNENVDGSRKRRAEEANLHQQTQPLRRSDRKQQQQNVSKFQRLTTNFGDQPDESSSLQSTSSNSTHFGSTEYGSMHSPKNSTIKSLSVDNDIENTGNYFFRYLFILFTDAP